VNQFSLAPLEARPVSSRCHFDPTSPYPTLEMAADAMKSHPRRDTRPQSGGWSHLRSRSRGQRCTVLALILALSLPWPRIRPKKPVGSEENGEETQHEIQPEARLCLVVFPRRSRASRCGKRTQGHSSNAAKPIRRSICLSPYFFDCVSSSSYITCPS
jgi:hypothetical protein